MMNDDNAGFAKKDVKRKVLHALHWIPPGEYRESGIVHYRDVPSIQNLYRLRNRNTDDFRVDGGRVIDPLQNSHRRVGKLSLRKNHHSIEWDSRQRLESTHSLQSLFGLPCETVGPSNPKLASCVVASVDGKRISGRVVLEKPYNLRYTPPPIPWNECN